MRPFAQALVQDFGFDERRRGETGVAGSIAGVRLDFVKYRYPLIAAPEVLEDIRFMSLPDVVAMKLSAVTNRGAKKDFFDLQMLITKFGLPTLFSTTKKIPTGRRLHASSQHQPLRRRGG